MSGFEPRLSDKRGFFTDCSGSLSPPTPPLAPPLGIPLGLGKGAHHSDNHIL